MFQIQNNINKLCIFGTILGTNRPKSPPERPCFWGQKKGALGQLCDPAPRMGTKVCAKKNQGRASPLPRRNRGLRQPPDAPALGRRCVLGGAPRRAEAQLAILGESPGVAQPDQSLVDRHTVRRDERHLALAVPIDDADGEPPPGQQTPQHLGGLRAAGLVALGRVDAVQAHLDAPALHVGDVDGVAVNYM